MSRKNGFTLSELVTVLVILGTVFMLVLPDFYHNSKKQEYRAGYLKALNVVNNAYAEYLKGGMDKGSSDTGALTQKVNDPAYIGTTNSDGVTMTSSADIVNKIFKKHINESNVSDSDTASFPGCSNDGVKFYAADGMRFCVMYSTCASNTNYSDYTCGEIWVDVNGGRNPNSVAADSTHLGDIYPIIIMKNRFVPGSTSNSTASTFAQNLYFGNLSEN